MNRRARWLAAFLFALMLPVQGLAAACAQICLKGQVAHLMQASAVHDGGQVHDCHDPAAPEEGTPPGEGKCCHAHTFMMEPPAIVTDVSVPDVQPVHFVARWTSYIPE
jgi:hypothetical protein